tara:strand:- start:258 stop:1226 length:969 start_codon:yes stop_codon:yes gene_type:complete
MESRPFVDKKLILIIGFRKCGTSTLYDYLVSQNVGSGCIVKEPQLLCSGNVLDEDFIKKYLNLFESDSDVIIDGSTFLVDDPVAIDEVKKIFREVKILVCVRNPIERFFSAYWHCRGKEKKQEKYSIENVISRIDSWGKEKFEKELQWVAEHDYYKEFYKQNYLKSQGIEEVEFNPVNNRLAFTYFGEGVYSTRLKKLDMSDSLIVYFEDFIVGGFCISELSDYLGVELKKEKVSEIGVSNKGINRSNVQYFDFIKKISIHKLIPVSFRQKMKKYLYKPIPNSKEYLVEIVSEWYEEEIQYWLSLEPRLNLYWLKNQNRRKN